MQKPLEEDELITILRTEFPLPDEETNKELASFITSEATAQKNILGILRQIQQPVTNDTLNLIITEIERGLSSYDFETGDYGPTPLPYDDEDGFAPFRTVAVSVACSALQETGLTQTTHELEDLNDWITIIDGMGLNPQVTTLEECRYLRHRWQRNLVEGNDQQDAATLLGRPSQPFVSWKPAIATRDLGKFTIDAIPSELKFAQAAIAVDPDFWHTYAGECRRNRARPFTITRKRNGKIVALALLRFRKGRWYIAVPNSYQRDSIKTRHPKALEKNLRKFGEDYHKEATRGGTKKKSAKANT